MPAVKDDLGIVWPFQPGDCAEYVSPQGDALVFGIVAEIKPSWVTPFEFRARIVDRWDERHDPDAGVWKNAHDCKLVE